MDNSLEHTIPEANLNLNVDYKNIDSYWLDSNQKHYGKPVDLNNYNIINSEYVKSLFSSIENKVLNKSESTLEIKPINYDTELKNVLANKEEANKFINTNLDEAINRYRKIIFDIEDCTKTLRDFEIDQSEVLKKIFEQKKLVMSNLSLAFTKKQAYKESIELDLYILSMDRKFEKSYGRLINSYTMIDDLDNANKYSTQMKDIFGGGIVEKYSNIFNNLENKNKRADDGLKLLSKKSSIINKKEDIARSEIGDDEDDKKTKKTENKVQSSKGRILKFFFGSFLFLGSSFWLFYLFKNKAKYLN